MNKIKVKKTKDGTKFFSYDLDLFSTKYVSFILVEDYETATKHLDIGFKPNTNSVACAVYNQETDFVGIILTKESNLGVLAHECVHLAIKIMVEASIPVNNKNDEVIAYLTEMLFNIGKVLFDV